MSRAGVLRQVHIRSRETAAIWPLALLVPLIAIGLAGCGAGEPVAPTEVPAPPQTPTRPPPTATLASSPTSLPSATPSPTATATSTPTLATFAGTALAPLDSLSLNGPFEGELALLTEIVLPPGGYNPPAFIPGTSELIYKYGLSLRRLDLATNRLVGELVPPIVTDLSDLRIAPGGDYAAMDDGGDMLVIDLDSGEVIRRIEVTVGYIFGIAIGPMGDYVLTMDGFGELAVWDSSTWEARSRFQHPASDLDDQLQSNPRFLPDGNRIALEGAPGQVYLFDLDGNQVGEVDIGARGELPLVGEPGGRLRLGPDRTFMVLDPEGEPLGGVRLILYDCHDPDAYALQLLILDAQGEQIGCQYLLDHDRYWLTDEQGATVATVDTQARRITFTWADGAPLGKVRVGFPEYGGALLEVLGRFDETVERTYLDDGRLLTSLPEGGAIGVFTGRQFLCVDLNTHEVTCLMPFGDLGRIPGPRSCSIPDGYWLALDKDLRMRLFDFVLGREALISQPIELYTLGTAALSPDRAFLALIITKPNVRNTFLQIWGYPVR